MNWLQGILFGLVTGISEFFPISAPAHMELLKYLFGVSGKDPALDLICSLASLLALLMAGRGLFDMVRRDMHMQQRGISARAYRGNRDMRIVRNAVAPMLILYVVLTYVNSAFTGLPAVCIFLLINGIILYVPSRMLQGNKDARSMSALDSLLLGLCGGLSAFSGISRIGLHISVSRGRGADSTHALNWALLLSLPALVIVSIVSLLSLATGFSSITFSCGFFTYLLVFLATFAGSYLSVFFVKILVQKNSISLFSYYCWGAALFTFIMYLI